MKSRIIFYFTLEEGIVLKKVTATSKRLIEELHRQAWEQGQDPSRIRIAGAKALDHNTSNTIRGWHGF